ncbi:MAG TPA: PAS domain-containing protein [Archangium sp.]|jgi:PAS domain-containing protein|nr:PAS domain-containing protein [Archangium sp.]
MITNIDFKVVFRAMPGVCFVVLPDESLTFVEGSDLLFKTLGLPREHLVGRGLFDVFNDPKNSKGMSALRQSLSRVARTKAPEKLDMRYDVRGQEHRWHTYNAPVLDDGGNVVGVVHWAVDTTPAEGKKA